MIKANELRIGNWVDVCDNYEILTPETFFYVNSDLVKPIPITDETLSILGFCNKFSDWIKDDIRLSFARKNRIIIMVNGAVCIMKGKNMKYLHQLQNIYFALTGKEISDKIWVININEYRKHNIDK